MKGKKELREEQIFNIHCLEMAAKPVELLRETTVPDMSGLSSKIPTFDKSFSYEYQKKSFKKSEAIQYITVIEFHWIKCSSMLLEDKVTFDTIWTFFGELRSSHKLKMNGEQSFLKERTILTYWSY